MTRDDIRAHVELRESDPLSLRPQVTDPSWSIPKSEAKRDPSPVALAFIKAAHESRP